MTDWFLSHTQLTPPHSHTTHSSHPSFSLTHNSLLLTRVLGTVEKVCFVWMILPTEHLMVLVHDVLERGLVRVFVNHYGYHVRASGSRLLLKVVLSVRTLAPH